MAKKAFEVNEKIRIDLISGREVEGEFVQKNQTSIIVKNCKDLLSGKLTRHNQTYYTSEIKKYYSIDGRERTKQQSVNGVAPNNGQADSGSGSGNNTTKLSPDLPKNRFTTDEIQRIQNSMTNAVYISQFDDKYHQAIADLKQQKIIAVNSENNFGRLDPKRPLVAIASGQRVFLFDMLRLGAMKKEFKEVFSANSPRKIIHRSTQFADYLAHTESCALNNVFDTLMVHFALKQTRECISLLECLRVYFDLPEESFDFAEKSFNFGARPLHEDAKLRSALNVQLLMELYWYFNDILMQPLRAATRKFSDIYRSIENQVDLMNEMSNGAYPGVENIDSNAAKQLEELFADFLVE